MKTYIPLNIINADLDKKTLRERLDKATREKNRLEKYNHDLKLQVLNLLEKINNIKKTTK
tara:strand:- start:182 stop:361 length:180 start_codon:yes stop_codon:yes gene_type:complete